jgi:hypothetical protein
MLRRRAAGYQVRRYQPFLVVEAPLDWSSSSSGSDSSSDSSGSSSSNSGSSGRSVNPASAGVQAFRALVGYISGSNAASKKFAMTTPVLTSSSGKMQFMIDPSAAKVGLGGMGKERVGAGGLCDMDRHHTAVMGVWKLPSCRCFLHSPW